MYVLTLTKFNSIILKVKLKVFVVKNLEGSSKDAQLCSIKIMSNVKYNLGAKILC